MFGENFIKTLTNGLLTKIKFTHSDWNVNDPSEEGYIKNRPFYFLDEEIICDANLDFSKGISYINNTTPVRDILKEGETYYVTWDGAEYECIAVKSDYEHVFVGNLSIAEDSEWATENHEPTNEPFFFGTYYVYNGENGTWKEINCLDTEIHTIKVVRRPNLVVQLDEKYIPDSIARSTDVEELRNMIVELQETIASLTNQQ